VQWSKNLSREKKKSYLGRTPLARKRVAKRRKSPLLTWRLNTKKGAYLCRGEKTIGLQTCRLDPHGVYLLEGREEKESEGNGVVYQQGREKSSQLIT